MDSDYDPALFEERHREQWEAALSRPPRPGEILAFMVFLALPFAIVMAVQAISGFASKVLGMVRRLAHA